MTDFSCSPGTATYTERDELIEDLTWVKQRVRNCRGAIESDQITDKDVRGSLLRVGERLDQILHRLAVEHVHDAAARASVSTETVDRVAKAIVSILDEIDGGGTPWDEAPEEARDGMRKLARAAIEAMPNVAQGSGWQPIETAPKDGSKIDLLYPYPRCRTIDCMWREGGVDGDGNWIRLKPIWTSQPGLGIDWHLAPESEWEVESYPNMQPTHWMPAVALPSTNGNTP